MPNSVIPRVVTTIHNFLRPGVAGMAALLVLSGCGNPSTEAPSSLSAAARIAPDINITCAAFNKLSPNNQKKATDRLLRNYKEASELSSDYADAREHSAINQKKLSGDLQLGDPSLLTLARHTCEIPANQDVRLLPAMGFAG